jgi:hypothetical protein
VSPRKKGAASNGLTIGNSPANVRRKALSTPFAAFTFEPRPGQGKVG